MLLTRTQIRLVFQIGLILVTVLSLGLGVSRKAEPVLADAAPPAPSISIDCVASGDGDIQSSTIITAGTTFNVDLWIKLAGGYESCGACAQLTWDPSIIQCQAVNVGSDSFYLYPAPSFQVFVAFDVSTPGQTNNTGPSSFTTTAHGSGVMARYTFKAITNGTTDINIVGSSISNQDGSDALLQSPPPPLPPESQMTIQNGTVTVGTGEPMPDLAITHLAAAWLDQETGLYSIDYTITNQGDADAAASQAQLFIDNQTQALATETVPVLAAGDSYQGNFNGLEVTLSDTVDAITLKCDGTGIVEESSENNNTAVYIWPQMADLVLTDFEAKELDEGQLAYRINYTVKNQGSLEAPAFKVGAFVDGSSSPQITETVSSLGIGAELEGNFQNYVFTVSGDSDIVEIYVDYEDAVTEALENNNTGSVSDPYMAAEVNINCTVAAAVIISFSVDDGLIEYGTIEFGGSRSTVDMWDTQTVKNTGEVTIDIDIKSSDATRDNGITWYLADTPGDEQYSHQVRLNSNTTWINLKRDYQPLIQALKPDQTATFDLKIFMPTYSVDPNPHNIRISLQATTHENP
ncbi:MAG: CARDB domain-containing protein [Dehalococcoidales bacterium]|jgi:hypothetical protein